MKFNYNNPMIREISEVYGRVKLYCIIQNLKDQLTVSTITQEYRTELEEALEYANYRKGMLIYEGC